MNTGQFIRTIRSEFLIRADGVNKVAGQPFKIGKSWRQFTKVSRTGLIGMIKHFQR